MSNKELNFPVLKNPAGCLQAAPEGVVQLLGYDKHRRAMPATRFCYVTTSFRLFTYLPPQQTVERCRFSFVC